MYCCKSLHLHIVLSSENFHMFILSRKRKRSLINKLNNYVYKINSFGTLLIMSYQSQYQEFAFARLFLLISSLRFNSNLPMQSDFAIRRSCGKQSQALNKSFNIVSTKPDISSSFCHSSQKSKQSMLSGISFPIITQ